MSELLPTGADRNLAHIEVTDLYPDDFPEDHVRTIPVADLVPGDAFAARGKVYVVTGFPDVYEHIREVSVPVDRHHHPLGAVEFVLDRKVVAWRVRRVNYGLIRCPGCGVNGGRDHHSPGSEDCLLMQQEREAKNDDY